MVLRLPAGLLQFLLIVLQHLSADCRAGLILSPTDLQVSHYSFPHTLACTECDDNIVVLQIYLSWRMYESRFTVRGWGFSEVAGHRNFFISQAAQPQAAQIAAPQLYFVTLANGKSHNATQTAWVNVQLPFTFTYTFDANPGLLQLRVWGTSQYYAMTPEAIPFFPSNIPNNCLISAMSSFQNTIPPMQAAQALVYNVQYHKQLGVRKTIMYTTGSYVPALLGNQDVVHLINAGILELVLWEDIPETDEISWYSQSLQYMHVMLAQWGRGCYVALIDPDEYITYTDLQHSILTEMQSVSANMSFWDLPRNDVRCIGCAHSDRDLWFGIAAASEQHPITHYEFDHETSSRHPNGKQIVHPDYMYTFNVHSGHVFPDSPPAVTDSNAIKLLHIVNMFMDRSV